MSTHNRRVLTGKDAQRVSLLFKKLSKANSTPSPSTTTSSRFESFKKQLESCTSILVEEPSSSPDLHIFSISIFSNLEELILDGVPPSTVVDIYNLRAQLERLEVKNSGIPELSIFLCPRLPKHLKLSPMVFPNQNLIEIPDDYKWSKLKFLSMTNCGLVMLDRSMHILPMLEVLDVSQNDISHIVHLQDCFSLSTINLSRNRVRVLSNIGRVLGNITVNYSPPVTLYYLSANRLTLYFSPFLFSLSHSLLSLTWLKIPTFNGAGYKSLL